MKVKNRVLSILLTLCLVLGLMPMASMSVQAVVEAWDGTTITAPSGSGTELDPYLIYTGEELAWLAQQDDNFTGKTILLMFDIDLDGHEWTPIGLTQAFKGTFDGNGYTISGLSITEDPADEFYSVASGLFGNVYSLGIVHNLHVQGSITSTAAQANVGGVVAYSFGGTVTNVSADVDISSAHSTSDVGGIVGTNAISSSVINVYSTGTISGSAVKGGVVGRNSGTVEQAYYLKTVSINDGLSGIGVEPSQAGDVAVDDTNAVNENVLSFDESGDLSQTAQFRADNGATSSTQTGSTTLSDALKAYYNVYIAEERVAKPTLRMWNNSLPYPGFSQLWTDIAMAVTEVDGTYTIKSQMELAWVAEQVNAGNDFSGKSIVLDNNIVLTGVDWEPIGVFSRTTPAENRPFNGTFDGNGKTISGLEITNSQDESVGLFGYVGSSGVVKNVTLTGTNSISVQRQHYYDANSVSYGANIGGVAAVNAGDILDVNTDVDISCDRAGFYAGGVIGLNMGIVEGVTSSGTISSNGVPSRLGGIVGANYADGTIHDALHTGTITARSGGDYIGGIVGDNDGGTLDDVLNDGTLTSGSAVIGGIAAFNQNDGIISNAENEGSLTVTNGNHIGGIVGINDGGIINSVTNSRFISIQSGYIFLGGIAGTNQNGGVIQNAANTRAVEVTNFVFDTSGYNPYVGGIVGSNIDASIFNSYNQQNVTAGYVGGGIAGLNQDNALIGNVYNAGTVTGTTAGGVVGYNYYVDGNPRINEAYWLTGDASSGIGYDSNTSSALFLRNVDFVDGSFSANIFGVECDTLSEALGEWAAVNNSDPTMAVSDYPAHIWETNRPAPEFTHHGIWATDITVEDIANGTVTITYGDAMPTISVDALAYPGTQTPTYAYYASSDTTHTTALTGTLDAGDYLAVATMTVTGTDIDFKGDITYNLTIEPKELDASMIADIADQTYGAVEIEPTLTVTDGSTPLAVTTDYTVAYTYNTDAALSTATNAPTATITAVDGSNYSGIASKTFTIDPYPLDGEPVIIAGYSSGHASIFQTLTAKFLDTSPALLDDFDFQWYAGNNVIEGATSQTYMPLFADSEKSLKVTVTLNKPNNYSPSDFTEMDEVDVAQAFIYVTEQNGGMQGKYDAGDTLNVLVQNVLSPESGTFAWYRGSANGTPLIDTDGDSDPTTYLITAEDVASNQPLIVVYTHPSDTEGKLEESLTLDKYRLSGWPNATYADTTVDGTNAWTAELAASALGYPKPILNTEYTIQWYRNGVAILGATDIEYILTKADLGAKLSAVASGMGEYTGDITLLEPKTLPAVNPEAPEISATPGNTEVTVTWTAPFDGGSILTGYTLNVTKVSDGSAVGMPHSIQVSDTSYIVDALENGIEYSFVMTATNDVGTSDPSVAVNATPRGPTSSGGGGTAPVTENIVDSEEVISGDDFKEYADSGESLTVQGEDIEAEFDNKALKAIDEVANGQDVQIIIEEANSEDLNAAQIARVGDRPIFNLKVLVNGELVTTFGDGSVSVSFKYDLREGEDPEKLVIYYIDDSGNIIEKIATDYDEATGTVTFKLNHFSIYMLAYEAMSFADVTEDDWYYDAVLYAFENEIMTGTSDVEFAPNDNMTRAMVWTVLARMSGIDTSGGDPWYSVAQDWAMENEVSDGTNPDGYITREEFATMLYRYVAPESVTQQTVLGQFSDSEAVSEWAVTAMEWAVAEGIITGIEGALEPQGEATRAQMATMLMRYMSAE